MKLLFPKITGSLCANSHPGSYTGQDAYNDMLVVLATGNSTNLMGGCSYALNCMHDQQIVITNESPNRKDIVRRLTPLECNRLQGFPDNWGAVSNIEDLTDEEVEFWENVRKTDAEIKGKEYKPKKDKKALIGWLNKLWNDSSEFRMWGNGIALPCAVDVLGRIANEVEKE